MHWWRPPSTGRTHWTWCWQLSATAVHLRTRTPRGQPGGTSSTGLTPQGRPERHRPEREEEARGDPAEDLHRRPRGEPVAEEHGEPVRGEHPERRAERHEAQRPELRGERDGRELRLVRHLGEEE